MKRENVLSSANFEKVFHTFISSRLDYCNSLYFGISQILLSCLQPLQNAAVRLLTGACKRRSYFPCFSFFGFQYVLKLILRLYWGGFQVTMHIPNGFLRLASGFPRSRLKQRSLTFFVPRTGLQGVQNY